MWYVSTVASTRPSPVESKPSESKKPSPVVSMGTAAWIVSTLPSPSASTPTESARPSPVVSRGTGIELRRAPVRAGGAHAPAAPAGGGGAPAPMCAPIPPTPPAAGGGGCTRPASTPASGDGICCAAGQCEHAAPAAWRCCPSAWVWACDVGGGWWSRGWAWDCGWCACLDCDCLYQQLHTIAKHARHATALAPAPPVTSIIQSLSGGGDVGGVAGGGHGGGDWGGFRGGAGGGSEGDGERGGGMGGGGVGWGAGEDGGASHRSTQRWKPVASTEPSDVNSICPSNGVTP